MIVPSRMTTDVKPPRMNTRAYLKLPLGCFDLKGMEALPDLQAICLFIITDFVWREVQADKTQMKFMIFDECWKLLENESGALFIAEVFRTFRKYMASAVAISQNIDDFAKSKVATAILPNASIKWILRQKGADQERLDLPASKRIPFRTATLCVGVSTAPSLPCRHSTS